MADVCRPLLHRDEEREEEEEKGSEISPAPLSPLTLQGEDAETVVKFAVLLPSSELTLQFRVAF